MPGTETTETPQTPTTTASTSPQSSIVNTAINWTKVNWIWLLVIIALIAVIFMKCNPFTGGAPGADLSEF